VYVGQKDATLSFEFEGTRLAILSVAGLGTNYKVEIDGVEVNSIDLVEYTGAGASFVSDLLAEGKHTVKITCLDTANIDSLVVW
jgi:predicted RecB family endonuclease